MDAWIALLDAVAKPLFLCFLPAIGLLGALAIASPQAFKRVAAISNHWVDTRRLLHIPNNKFLQLMDRWVDTDRYFSPHIRLLGIATLLGAALFCFIYSSV